MCIFIIFHVCTFLEIQTSIFLHNLLVFIKKAIFTNIISFHNILEYRHFYISKVEYFFSNKSGKIRFHDKKGRKDYFFLHNSLSYVSLAYKIVCAFLTDSSNSRDSFGSRIHFFWSLCLCDMWFFSPWWFIRNTYLSLIIIHKIEKSTVIFIISNTKLHM